MQIRENKEIGKFLANLANLKKEIFSTSLKKRKEKIMDDKKKEKRKCEMDASERGI